MHDKCSPGTYSLLRRLSSQFPDIEFYFVIGTDLLPGLKNWYSEEITDAGLWLIANAKFIVVPRPGYDDNVTVVAGRPNFVFLKPLPGCTLVSQELSSTNIRTRLQEGSHLVDGLTPPIVLAHIIRNQLFLDPKSHGKKK